MLKNIGIGWQLHNRTGWGIYGINLALQLLSRPSYLPTLLFPPGHLPEHPLHRERLTPIIANFNQLTRALKRAPGFKSQVENLTILHGLGNNFIHNESPLASTREAGVIFFENTLFNDVAKDRAKRFPLIITGSHWNEEILKKNNFPGQIETVIQGIDPTVFYPAPKSGIFRNRFVIFSGGKLEYRKGQDIVIEAFKIFQQRHPETLLLASWHNSWPESMAEITTVGHVSGLPDSRQDQQKAISGWLINNGLKEGSFIVLPETPNIYMALVIRETNVALFPNRGEGGTNLVAMEALACGIPTILAANSGQLDFADANICYPIRKQGKVKATINMPGVEGWGESSIEEIVETLEEIYNDPDRAQRRADHAVKHMQNFTWENQVDKLLQKIDEFFASNH